MLINQSAAWELQSRFEGAGENSSFDYVERPGATGTAWFRPASVFMLSLALACQTVALLLVAGMLARPEIVPSPLRHVA